MLGKESGKSFLDEKLRSLILVNEYLSVVKLFNSKSLFFISLKGPLLSDRIYTDATVRFSQNIQFLIKKEDFDTVYNLMIYNGYKLCNGEVWPDDRGGQRVKLNSPHHMTFCKTGAKFMVEIHWLLFQNIPVSLSKFSRIVEESVIETTFNGELVRCFSHEFELIYIILHGSKHCWSRLKWLVDIKDYPLEGLDSDRFSNLISQLSAQRVLTQTNFLLHRYFNTKLPFKGSRRVNSFILGYPLDCINSTLPDTSSAKESLKRFFYNSLLFPGILYKLRLFTSLIRSGRCTLIAKPGLLDVDAGQVDYS